MWGGMLWSFEGLIILATVFQHLNAILTFVFLDMFVTLRICGEMYVNVTHLSFLFIFMRGVLYFVLCFIWCLGFCIMHGPINLSFTTYQSLRLASRYHVTE